MLPATLPQFEPKYLFHRLTRLRRRLRLVALFQGAFALFAVLVGGLAVAGLIDWRWPLPPLVRALALVGIVAAAGVLLIRRLIMPLRQPVDNLHLALQLETKNPELNDALASAVQFMEQPADDESSSPLLRRIAIRRALQLARDCNFSELISLRGMLRSGFAAALVFAVVLPIALKAPAQARLALSRVLAPFGATEWPAATQVRVLSPDKFPHRHPLGEELEIRAEISGVIPDRATLTTWSEGTPPVDQLWTIENESGHEKTMLTVRIEASRIQRNFKFRLKVNDGQSPWHEVVVQAPPEIVPIDGRPSPQLRLEFPHYTNLKPRQMPDGGSSFEGPAGTTVRLRAGLNRPVARAFIVYRPDQAIQNTSSAFLPLGTISSLESITSTAASRDVWDRIPVTLSRGGTLMEAAFTPRLAGTYALRFEDETGFGGTRLIDARVMTDPAPVVSLDRPSQGHDSLYVTPTAVLPLQSIVSDPMYAVRSAWLEYRSSVSAPIQTRPIYDHRFGWTMTPPARLRLPTLPRINGRLRIAELVKLDGTAPKEGDTILIRLAADDFDDVSGDKEPGRSHEVELRIVAPATLEAMLQQEQANVRQNLLNIQRWQKEAREKVNDAKLQKDATGKLRPEDLEKLLQAEQLQQQIRARIGDEKEGLRAEVNRIRDALRDNQLPPSTALDRMDTVANELERLAREELEPIEPLLNAARENPEGDPMKSGPMNTDPTKGDPMKSDPMKSDPTKGDPMKSDPMKSDPTKGDPMKSDPTKGDPMKSDPTKSDPMKSDPMKSDPSKRDPMKSDPMKSDSTKNDPMKSTPEKVDPTKPNPAKPDAEKEPLREALRHQQEIEKTVDQLLQRLEPWSGANEVRGELRALLDEQEKLGKQTDQLDAQLNDARRNRPRLDEQEQADLDRTAARQDALANQLKQQMDKMKRLAEEKREQEKQRLKTAEDLENKAKERERLAEENKGTPKENDLRAEAQKLREQAQDQRTAAKNLQKEAEALKDAAKMAREELNQDPKTANPQTKLHQAANEMKENQLGKARQQQKDAAKGMQKVLDRLEEKRTDDLDRLAKKMKEVEQRLDALVDQQERLQKKVQAAQNIANPEQRQQELERLAREQERLREEGHELVQELSRLKADGAAQALNRANRGMDDAQQRLERGEKADTAQEDVLEKLDQAQDQLEQARKQTEDELLREKTERATARIKNLRDQQETANREMKRLHDKAIKAKKWDDDVLLSLGNQIDVERRIAGELEGLTKTQFKPIKVAAKMLEHASEAMRMAADKIEARQKDIKDRPLAEPFDEKLEASMQADTVKWQETALRRLDQFLDALKPDKELRQPNNSNAGGGGGSPGGGGGGSGGIRRPGGEDVPLLAQLKALRSLQAELNERTAEFAKTHPDLTKLTETDKEEIALLRKMQRDVADLIQEYDVVESPKAEAPK